MKSVTLLIFSFLFLSTHSVAGIAAPFSASKEQSQARKITGLVKNAQNEALADVSVLVKETNSITITDLEGKFSLDIPVEGSKTIIFSFIGMKTVTVNVTTQTTLDITLEYSAESINEAVIVGAYGTIQRKSDMVGSAFQVNQESIKNLPSSRVDVLLDGLVPGLTVEPNADYATGSNRYNVRIRGSSSLSAGREPLWVIDGVPKYTGDRTNQITGMSYAISPLSFIDPNDIESITVLKDAVETSIYGANGSNGIIFITTKKGKRGEPEVRAMAKYSVGTIDKSTKFKVLDATQYLSYAQEAWVNAGLDLRGFPYQDNDLNSYSTTNTDWYKQFFGIGQDFEATVSVAGGSDKMSNYMSLGYFKSNPMVIGTSQERFSMRMNSDYTIRNKLKAAFKAGISYNIHHIYSAGYDYYETPPVFTPYYDNGDYRLLNKIWEEVNLSYNPSNPSISDIDPWTGQRVTENKTVFFPYERRYRNPIAERDLNDNRQRSFSSDISVQLGYEILPGLDLTAHFGVNYMGSYEDLYYARGSTSGIDYTRPTAQQDPQRRMIMNMKGYSTRGQANNLGWVNIERLNFNRRWDEHSVNGLAGIEFKNWQYFTLSSSGNGFPNDKIKEISYAQDETRRGSSNSNINRNMSYFVQGKYAYDNRYYLTVNFRADGNSDFGAYQKWGNFFSAGVGWNIHNEHFIELPSYIDRFRIKASYGTSGNSRISDAASYGVYTYSDTYSYQGTSGATMTSSPNPGLTWETVYKTNVGLALQFLKRFEIDIDLYRNITDNLLSELPTSETTGERRMFRNAGKIRNLGIEGVISSHNFTNGDFSWRTDLNISHNKNKILKLYNESGVSFFSTGWYEGQDIDVYTLIRWAGVDPRDGSPLWYDKNGDLTRTYSYDNRVPYKTSAPTLTGGMTNAFSWKEFEFRFFLNYTIGGWLYSTFANHTLRDGYDIIDSNASVNALDHWKKPGDLSPNPRAVYRNSSRSTSYNTRNLYNKTNLRLQNVALSYDIPSNIARKMSVRYCRLSLIGDNIAIWTTQRNDPNRNSYKTLKSGYPAQRTFSLSLDLTL